MVEKQVESILQRYLLELRCPGCGGRLASSRESIRPTEEYLLVCRGCHESYPVQDGIPRMLPLRLRRALDGERIAAGADSASISTAESFGYEWNHFSEMREEWRQNFLDYMAPHGPEFFPGKRVLDAGCGSGRHSYYAALSGAEVWAVDMGSAIEVAHRNTRGSGSVQVVQADLRQLPFEPESFDFIYSIGVLHHLSDPESAFRNLLRYLKPNGEIQVYLYWKPEGQIIKRALLAAVSALRQVTTRIPYGVLYRLSYPAAAIAYAGFVWPYRLLKATGLGSAAERLPMKQYARYPFRVCVNDQFDRLSAPIEYRYTRAEVVAWFERAGLKNVTVRPNFGWCATGRKVGTLD